MIKKHKKYDKNIGGQWVINNFILSKYSVKMLLLKN